MRPIYNYKTNPLHDPLPREERLHRTVFGYIRLHCDQHISNDIIDLIKMFHNDILTFIVRYKDIPSFTNPSRHLWQTNVLKLYPIYSCTLLHTLSLQYKHRHNFQLSLCIINNSIKLIITNPPSRVLIYYELHWIQIGAEIKATKRIKCQNRKEPTKYNSCEWNHVIPNHFNSDILTFKCYIDIIGYYKELIRGNIYSRPLQTEYDRNFFSKPLTMNATVEYEWIVNKRKLILFGSNQLKTIYSETFGGINDENKCWYMDLQRIRQRNVGLKLTAFRFNAFEVRPVWRLEAVRFVFVVRFNFDGKVVEYHGVERCSLTHKSVKLYPTRFYQGPLLKYFHALSSSQTSKSLSIKVKIDILHFSESETNEWLQSV
eukprot:62080_1